MNNKKVTNTIKAFTDVHTKNIKERKIITCQNCGDGSEKNEGRNCKSHFV